MVLVTKDGFTQIPRKTARRNQGCLATDPGDQEPTLVLRLVVLVLKLLEPIHVIVQHRAVTLR